MLFRDVISQGKERRKKPSLLIFYRRIAHTLVMKRLRRWYKKCKKKYLFLASKKYTTLAGTLVFFFIMSVMPFSFWLSLLVAKLPVDTDLILELSVFDSVKNVLLYVRREASNATTGVSIVLPVTTLYSATNLFYQMRRSGEIIYEYRRPKHVLKLRVGALVLLAIVLAMIIVFLFFFAFGALVVSKIFSETLGRISDYVLLVGLSFLLVMLLNAYICPYRVPFRRFLLGSCVTVAAWAAAVVGFSVYLKIGNLSRLYGALSAAIIFLLWLYLLMIGFIVGVIVNSEKITKEQRARRTKKK